MDGEPWRREKYTATAYSKFVYPSHVHLCNIFNAIDIFVKKEHVSCIIVLFVGAFGFWLYY